MELTKDDNKMLQGLSILAMVCLHLFNRDYHELFQPIIFVFGIPVSYYISLVCDFCVMGFAFGSGYAHILLFENTSNYYKDRVKSVKLLLVNYWFIILVFSVISIIKGNSDFMPGDIKKLVLNVVLLESSYNGAWWYMFVYIILITVSPIIFKGIKKNTRNMMIVSFLVYCVSHYIRFNVNNYNLLWNKIGPLGMTFFEYVLGAIFYEVKLFTGLYNVWRGVPKLYRDMIWAFLLITMPLIRVFFAPMTGIIIIVSFHFWEKPDYVKKLFRFIGIHSTNIWLTHMFFYATLFRNFVYKVKYPIFIFGLMIVLTVLTSQIIKQLQRLIIKSLFLKLRRMY